MDPAVLAKQADALRAGLALLAIVNGAVPLRISAPAEGLLYVTPGRGLEYRSDVEEDEYNLAVLRMLSEILGRPLIVGGGSGSYLSVRITLVLFDVEVEIYEVVNTPEGRDIARQLATPAPSGVAA
ncbi:hypothetical protein BBK14_24405 [Parafrankia soli]|uniref:Uncharacterized protein n=2 Tax=Parafrankia soli TaxID=2599596 RepID=A0A1S1PPQ3_9ACTN|nr:hypothetical protein BBK14_24405 [Parafrankia soli]